MHELLNTYTEGQLKLLSIASRVQYAAMKRKMDQDAKYSTTSKSSGYDESGVEYVRPTKPVSKMTQAELSRYYAGAGV